MKLALGTVQLGLDYGISNPGGRTPPDEARRVLDAARAAGMELLDTAASYGEAEAVLGRLANGPEFRVVTKTCRFGKHPIRATDAAALRQTLLRSLARLRREAVEGLLVHHAPDLLAPGGEGLFAEMQRLRDEGRVRKIGVSVYTPEEAEQVLARFAVQLIQVPCSVFDQRLLGSGWLRDLARRGVEIHARSVFLQGLLLMEPAALPPYFAKIRPALEALRAAARTAGTDMLGLCLGFVQRLPEVNAVVCGVTRAAELSELVERGRAAPQLPDLRALAQSDPAILDPSRWPPRALP
jgi:aryl-alcohol dehydrogenase-like predicted oxidoreductase